MKTDEFTVSKQKNNTNVNKKIKYLKNLITRILLSIILLISICITIKLNENNKTFINKYLFEDSIEFTKINNWYHNKIGNIIPEVKSNDSSMVFSSNDFKTLPFNTYLDGVKFSVDKNSPVSLLYGGIVIFIGNKDGYGNTVIIQGNDGIDYWYGNISNININLYDYLDKDTLIGETQDNFMYLVLEKSGSYLSYEEYIK